MKFLAVLALCVAAASAAPSVLEYSSPAITLREYWSLSEGLGQRIVGGNPAVAGQFYHQCSNLFTTSAGQFICGCAAIHSNWALTAAHCAVGASSFNLGFGSLFLTAADANRITRTTTTGIVHPNYNSNNLNNDVALINWGVALPLGALVGVARLPNTGQTLATGATARVSGWGRTSDANPNVSPTLNYVDLTIISNAACAAVYGSDVVVPSTVCAVGGSHPDGIQSTCNGDSGGPLGTLDDAGVFTHEGVVSFVHVAGCGSGNPSGYVRTESMLGWIFSHVPQ